MTITVNGEERDVAAGATVADVLAALGLSPKTVLVQRNDDIIERAEFDNTHLSDGDALELVRLVGGG